MWTGAGIGVTHATPRRWTGGENTSGVSMEATARGGSQLRAAGGGQFHAEPIDLGALVHRGEVFRRVRAVALGGAILMFVLLGGYAFSNEAALVPLLCFAATTSLGATYVATRLACAPLPRVHR